MQELLSMLVLQNLLPNNNLRVKTYKILEMYVIHCHYNIDFLVSILANSTGFFLLILKLYIYVYNSKGKVFQS